VARLPTEEGDWIMPNVPRKVAPEIRNIPIAGVEQSFTIPAGAFGSGGAVELAYGEAGVKLGEMAQNNALVEQADDDDRRAKERFVRFNQRKNDILYGAGQYYDKRGADAVDAFPAARQAISDLQKEFSKEAMTDGERRIWSSASFSAISTEDNVMIKHSSSQRLVAADNATANVIEDAIDQATKSQGNIDITGAALLTIRGQMIEFGKRKGWTPGQINEAIEVKRTELVARTVRTVLGNGQTGSAFAAEEILNRYQDSMDESVVSKLRGELKNPKASAQAYVHFDSIIDNPRLTTPAMRRKAAKAVTDPTIRGIVEGLLSNHEAAVVREDAVAQKSLRMQGIALANSGKRVEEMDPEIQNALHATVSMVRNLNARADAIKSGVPLNPTPDSNAAFSDVYELLINNQVDFLELDLSIEGDYYHRLIPRHWEFFTKMQATITKEHAVKKDKETRTDIRNKRINSAMLAAKGVINSLGLTKEQIGAFQSMFIDEVGKAVDERPIDEKGKPIGDQFFSELAKGLFLRVESEEGWLSYIGVNDPNKRLYKTDRAKRQSIVNFEDDGPDLAFEDIWSDEAKAFVTTMRDKVNDLLGTDTYTLDFYTRLVESEIKSNRAPTPSRIEKLIRAGVEQKKIQPGVPRKATPSPAATTPVPPPPAGTPSPPSVEDPAVEPEARLGVKTAPSPEASATPTPFVEPSPEEGPVSLLDSIARRGSPDWLVDVADEDVPTSVDIMANTLVRFEGRGGDSMSNVLTLEGGLTKVRKDEMDSLYGRELSVKEARKASVYEDFKSLVRNVQGFDNINAQAQTAILDVTYNLGNGWITNPRSFKKLKALLGIGDVVGALKETLDTANREGKTVRSIAERRAIRFNAAVPKQDRITAVEQLKNGKIIYYDINGDMMFNYKTNGGKHPDSVAKRQTVGIGKFNR
jgi:GH24 family phage-related lysozyme (muramidase)